MTAKEILNKDESGIYNEQDILKAMKEYAELKCKELLQTVAEKAKTKTVYESDGQPSSSFPDFEYEVVDKNSILNAVDLKEFIK